MGTRGSAGIIYEEKIYATYNHFDSYPDGLGGDVVKFINAVQSKKSIKELVIENEKSLLGKIATKKLLDEFLQRKQYLEILNNSQYSSIVGFGGWTQLAENLKKVQEIDVNVPPTKEIQDKYQNLGYCNLGVSTQSPKEWYCLLRETQGIDTFAEIYKGNLEHISNDKDFFKDSLYCEWGYLINLDTMKFEVYEGFQKTPQKGNRFGEESNENGYYSCALVAEFELENIPPDWEKEILPEENE